MLHSEMKLALYRKEKKIVFKTVCCTRISTYVFWCSKPTCHSEFMCRFAWSCLVAGRFCFTSGNLCFKDAACEIQLANQDIQFKVWFGTTDIRILNFLNHRRFRQIAQNMKTYVDVRHFFAGFFYHNVLKFFAMGKSVANTN